MEMEEPNQTERKSLGDRFNDRWRRRKMCKGEAACQREEEAAVSNGKRQNQDDRRGLVLITLPPELNLPISHDCKVDEEHPD